MRTPFCTAVFCETKFQGKRATRSGTGASGT